VTIGVNNSSVIEDGLRRSAHQGFVLASVLILLLATSIRVYHISQRSLWLDEAIAANISRGTFTETLILTRSEHSAPIVDPLILFGVEKVAAGPLAVRTPSLVASVLAVFLMLCLVSLPSVDPKTAILSALMLSMSAAQIRYAQEVREYSLSVLYATLLLYFFISFTSNSKKRKSPTSLCLALFAAPLVQYGLVLFSAGILAALLILWCIHSRPQIRFLHILKAGMFLSAGGLLSFVLTLRYQWGEATWYLQDYYLGSGSTLPYFVWSNTLHLVAFLLPGLMVAFIAATAIVVHLLIQVRARAVSPLTILAFTSISTVLMCALLHLYPYGPIRQCLFLAPVTCLLAAASIVEVANRFTHRFGTLAIVLIAGVVVVSGIRQIRSSKPYAEVEDIQKVLLGLQSRFEPGDGVYVYSGAVSAVDFYVKPRDSRFIYGDYHRDKPERYASEMVAGLRPQTKRVWILFSHVYQDENNRILRDLSNDWEEGRIVSAEGAALYLLQRHLALVQESSTDRNASHMDTSAGTAERTPVIDRAADGFWDWNIRNSRAAGR
jgi:hypothetical protein